MSFEEWWYAKYGSESCKDRAEDAYTAGYEAGIEAAAEVVHFAETDDLADVENDIRQLKRGERE